MFQHERLNSKASQHEILLHAFTDDFQLAKHVLVDNVNTGKQRLFMCTEDIVRLCCSLGLKANTDQFKVYVMVMLIYMTLPMLLRPLWSSQN